MSTTMASRTFAIDPAHTYVGFSVRHMMIAKVRGSFHSVTGTIELPQTGLIPVSVSAEVDVASVDTREAGRDTDLQSDRFFSAAAYPKMRFQSTVIEATGDTHFRLTGTLEIRGAKQTVTFDAEAGGLGKNISGSGQRLGYEAKATIKRSDFGMEIQAGGTVVSDEVDIILDIEALG